MSLVRRFVVTTVASAAAAGLFGASAGAALKAGEARLRPLKPDWLTLTP